MFTYIFEESNKGKDLKLGNIRNGIPSLRGRGDRGEGSSIELHGPGPGDTVSVNNVSNKCKHGNTSVLDFGFSQETNGGLLGRAPEVLTVS